jgi:hypothetical protein
MILEFEWPIYLCCVYHFVSYQYHTDCDLTCKIQSIAVSVSVSTVSVAGCSGSCRLFIFCSCCAQEHKGFSVLWYHIVWYCPYRFSVLLLNFIVSHVHSYCVGRTWVAVEQYSKCKVSDSHSGVAEGLSFLGCDTLLFGEWLLTFW